MCSLDLFNIAIGGFAFGYGSICNAFSPESMLVIVVDNYLGKKKKHCLLWSQFLLQNAL